VAGASVYLFTPDGSYLGRSETTDTNGVAEFLVPGEDYKFRVDHGGSQYWSDVVTIMPFEENNIELNLDLLALDLTNDPTPDIYHGKAAELEKEQSVMALLSALSSVGVETAHAQGGGETLYFFINDHLGTPQMVVDESGTVVWSADYRPFGEVNETVETFVNNFRFAGQYYDSETGLHYNYFRYYDLITGRFVTADPIGLLGGANLFVLSMNNPVNLSDIFGLRTEVIVWQPVGWGTSSFGHVSVIINEKSYSFAPGGMDVRSAEQYLARNAFREGVGSELDLDSCEEKKFEEFLKNYHDRYFWPFTACVSPIQQGLKSVGYDLGTNLFPVSLGHALIDTGMVKRFEFYDATQPRKGYDAPWAK